MIVRHGEAEAYASSDDSRALTDVGRVQVELVAQFLGKLNTKIDLVAYSPLVRTTQTAKIILDSIDAERIEVWPELIHSSTAEMAEAKLVQAGCDNILLVSHMPLVAMLEAYLLDGESHFGQPFHTAELSILKSEDAYPGGWQLVQRQVLS